MKNETTRRDLLKVATIAGATAVGAGVMGYAAGSPVKANGAAWPFPLTKTISPKKAAQAAYDGYYVKGCMYGVLVGVLKDAAEKMGEPYASFPWDVAHFGAGGVELQGSTCGTLNGAAMALGLLVQDTALRRQMCNQLFTWYEKTKLPTWTPKKPPEGVPKKLARSIANSPICHTSISRWIAIAGFDAFSPQRANRCGRVAASVAKFTAMLINEALIKGKLKSRPELSTVATACLSCHGAGDAGFNEPNVLSRMDCEPCHDPETDKTVFPHP